MALCAGACAIAITITLLRLAQDRPNPTIAALLLLLVVLVTATVARLRIAVALSAAAMLAFNFFLLPPFNTLTIADPQNWVALFVFVVVAVVASRLSGVARQRAGDAEARKLEVQRLFDLSRDILLATEGDGAIAGVARSVARRFALHGVAVCLPGERGWELHQGGENAVQPAAAQLDDAFARLHGPLEYDARLRAYGGHATIEVAGKPVTLIPLRLGTRSVGMLAVDDPRLDIGALDALGGVVAIAIERTHFLAERVRSAAFRQRADLASALLASFSHDLRTPVTSVRMAVSNLQDMALPPEERRAQAQLAVQELDRLTRLLQDILDMARIDTAAVRPAHQWVSPADVVEAAVAHVGPALAAHRLQLEADDRSLVQIDPQLTSNALAHVLENAARYSPEGSRIAVGAMIVDDGVQFVVRDEGPGLEAVDLDHVFEPFYRGRRPRHATGTGLGLAITRGLLAAEGGRVWCENLPRGGAQFSIGVPAAVRAFAADAS